MTKIETKHSCEECGEKTETFKKCAKCKSKMNKKAFYTPFDVKSRKEYYSSEGYLKELGNTTLSALAGGAMGGVAGGAVGAGLAAAIWAGLPAGYKKNLELPAALMGGAALGGLPGMLVGGVVGDYKSMRKTEREAGVDVTRPLGYIGRKLGSSLTGTIIPIPVVGPAIGDYVVSRKMLDNRMGKEAEYKAEIVFEKLALKPGGLAETIISKFGPQFGEKFDMLSKSVEKMSPMKAGLIGVGGGTVIGGAAGHLLTKKSKD